MQGSLLFPSSTRYNARHAAVMAFQLEEVRSILKRLAGIVEDLWIEREALRSMLTSEYGARSETIASFVQHKKTDAKMRAQAHENFAKIWAALNQHGSEAFLKQSIEEGQPKRGKPN
jgi:hypothetical protein